MLAPNKLGKHDPQLVCERVLKLRAWLEAVLELPPPADRAGLAGVRELRAFLQLPPMPGAGHAVTPPFAPPFSLNLRHESPS